MAEKRLTLDDTVTGEAPLSAEEAKDANRCRHVENALYRRACGYKIKLKKSFKVKTVEYDQTTGKKLAEREDLKDGFEEVHIPADVRVCAYYLNNRDPERWREHPKEGSEELMSGVVAYPPMAEEISAEDAEKGGELT